MGYSIIIKIIVSIVIINGLVWLAINNIGWFDGFSNSINNSEK